VEFEQRDYGRSAWAAVPALNVQHVATTPRPSAGTLRRNLIIGWRKDWQDIQDWHRIAGYVREIDPSIETFVVNSDLNNSYTRRKARERPTLVVSASPLRFKPARGRVYQGGPIAKLKQLKLLSDAGLPVPKTIVLMPGVKLDPAEWGEFVIVKPTDIMTSSKGNGIELMRTERVRYIRPQDYPLGHPGRRGPMVAQQYIHTGEEITLYRVLTLLGEPLYQALFRVPRMIADPTKATDEELAKGNIATQGNDSKVTDFVEDERVLALARRIHEVAPSAPTKGCDIIREEGTGRLFVLEFNPGGNTWHFSSRMSARPRANRPPEHEQRRHAQFDAFRTAARVLVERTNAEAV
jgi:hypothetical protein